MVTNRGYSCRNVAVTFRAWSIVTWHVPAPEQAPLQPAKVPVVASAVMVTTVPLANWNEHVPLVTPTVTVQSTPAGLETIVPLPVSLPATVSVFGCGTVNVAVTFRA